MNTIILNGSDFDDLDGFYETIYSLMDWQEDWTPAHSLDALNDVLYSGFGKDEFQLVWEDADKSRSDLGLSATRAFYQNKIDRGAPFNVEWAKQKLDSLNSGNGQTLFEILVEILESHCHVRLSLK